MTKKFPSQQMDRFNVRLPSGMRDEIAKRAESHGRSMNSEIVQILEDALSIPPSVSGYRNDIEKLADQQSKEVKKMVFSTLVKLYESNNKND